MNRLIIAHQLAMVDVIVALVVTFQLLAVKTGRAGQSNE